MDDDYGQNQLPATGLTTERATAILIFVALLLLFLINRGFRGVNVAGASVSIS